MTTTTVSPDTLNLRDALALGLHERLSRARIEASVSAKQMLRAASEGGASPEAMTVAERMFEDLARYEELAATVPLPDPYREAGRSVICDLARRDIGMAAAGTTERLAMMQRIGSLTGLQPGAWLLEELATVTAGYRPLADVLSRPMPQDGSAGVTVAKVTTGATVEAQDGPGAAVTDSDIVIDGEEIAVATVHGGLRVSMQLLQRGAAALDQVISGEIGSSYGTRTEDYLINGTGTDGEPLGLLNTPDIGSVTYTDASPTGPKFAAKVAAAATVSVGARDRLPDLVAMHPRRWYHTLATAGSETSAKISTTPPPGAPPQAVGQVAGLAVIASPAIPTNLGAGDDEDVAIVLPSDTLLLESVPRVHTTDVDDGVDGNWRRWVGLYGYLAVAGWQYAADIVTIGGTGMKAVAS